MNHGIVPFVPVTAIPLPAHQDKCSFSSLVIRYHSPLRVVMAKSLVQTQKWLWLGLYLQELAMVSQFT